MDDIPTGRRCHLTWQKQGKQKPASPRRTTGPHPSRRHWRQTQTEIVDLGFWGKDVDTDNPGLEIIHWGRFRMPTKMQRCWLKRRQAVEPALRHTKSDKPHAALLAPGSNRRRAACPVLPSGLQHPLAAQKAAASFYPIWDGRCWATARSRWV